MCEAPFRLGLIGAGVVTRTLHFPSVLASTRVVLSALVDPNVERARQLAREFGQTTKIAPRVEDILSDVDGVLIATPNHTHHDIAVTCLGAGVPCLVEKPLATTVAEAEEMCQAAEQAGKVLAVGYTTRFRDEVVLLHDLLEARYFGAVRRFHYQEGTIGGWSPVSGYITDRKAAGGGVLTVVGTHFMDRMLYWFGYPDDCGLVDDAQGGPEAHACAMFKYSTGCAPFEGSLLLSKTVKLRPGLVIQAERGDVIFPMGRSPLYFRPREYPKLQQILAPRGRRVFSLKKDDAQLEIENFADACLGRATPIVDGRQALLSVRLLTELYSKRTPLRESWAEAPGPVAT